MPRSDEANQRIREEQRAKILDAARKVFARKGTAATMADIAEEAAISQGLAYRYFANKDAIFREMVEQTVHAGTTFSQRFQDLPGTPGERLALLLARFVKALRTRPEMYQLLLHTMRDDATSGDFRQNVQGMYQGLFTTIRQLIVAGQHTGEVAAGDPEQLATVLIASLEGLTRLAVNSPERFSQHVPDAEILLRLLKP